jgi:hypothetical protein
VHATDKGEQTNQCDTSGLSNEISLEASELKATSLAWLLERGETQHAIRPTAGTVHKTKLGQTSDQMTKIRGTNENVSKCLNPTAHKSH